MKFDTIIVNIEEECRKLKYNELRSCFDHWATTSYSKIYFISFVFFTND